MTNYNEGYLTQENLGTFLKNNVDAYIHEEFPTRTVDEEVYLAEKYGISSYQKKYDFAFEIIKDNEPILYLVEFDGIQHYTNPKQVLKDRFYRNKENVSSSNMNIEFISIPFFIQLNKTNANDIFKGIFDSKLVDSDGILNFPSGFWSDNAIYNMTPAFFCKTGYDRFLDDLLIAGEIANKSVFDSLKRGEALSIDRDLLYFD